MACKPGDITQLTCSGEDICSAVSQVASHAGRLVDHENRLTANEADIAKNKADILDLKFDNLEPRIEQNENDIQTLNDDVLNVSSNLSALNTRVVVNESDISAIQGDISGLPTLYASINGNSTINFSVADPSSPEHAVSLQYADANYTNSSNYYDKATSDARFLGIQAVAYDADKLGGSDWGEYVQKTHIASKTAHGVARQATDSEAVAGLVDDCYMSPKQVADAIAATP